MVNIHQQGDIDATGRKLGVVFLSQHGDHVFQAALTNPLVEQLQHLGLNVVRIDFPRGPHALGEQQGVEAISRADIGYGRTGLDPDLIQCHAGMLFRLTLGPRQPIRAFGSHHRRDFAFGDRVLILRAAGNQKTEGEEEALHFDIIAHMSHVVRAFALFVAAAIVLPAQSLTTVYEFNGLNGRLPTYGALVEARNGDLYGTTFYGGTVDNGTIYEFTPGGALPTTLHSFCTQAGCPDGANPSGGMIQATNGLVYGTTSGGGTSGNGTIFSIDPSATLTTVHNFQGADGTYPVGKLLQGKSGILYGTTSGGGAYGHGTIFSLTPGGTLTTIYSFCSQSGCPDGDTPWAGLVQAASGELYGTTVYGGVETATCVAGCGTVFRITPGGTLTTAFSFDDTDGRGPLAGLIQATNGKFYGTTDHGGTKVDGTLFEFIPGGPLTNLYNFDDGADGANPFAAVVQVTYGELYGTTPYGGAGGGYGTIFRISGVPQ